jgi:hypothetical protein
MELRLPDANFILGKTPACLDLLLRDLPDDWLRANEGPETWSCYDVVGHLIHGELTDWMPRLQMILEHGADRALFLSIASLNSRAIRRGPLASCLTDSDRCGGKILST